MQDLSSVAEIAIVEAAIALRNMSIMPRKVSRDLDATAAMKNKVIQVPVWPAMVVQDVTPGRNSYNTPQDLKPDFVSVVLDQWKEVPFTLSDREIAEVEDNRVLPPVILRAVAALSDTVNGYILNDIKNHAFNTIIQGTEMTLDDLVDMKKLLDVQNTPRDGRRFAVLDHNSDADLLKLSTFNAANQAGSPETQITGELGGKFGFDTIHSDGMMPRHVQGVVTGTGTITGVNAADPAFSGGTSKNIAISGGTSGMYAPGDIITIGSDPQEYAVVSVSGDVTGGTIEVAPQLKVATTGGESITQLAAGADQQVAGFGMHEMAYAFATRPLQTQVTPGVIVSTATDETSGLTLRITVDYANKALTWSIDILYGGKVVYPEMIARYVNAD